MKKVLFLLALLFALQTYAVGDCDLFKQEVAVLSEQVQDMYKDMYEAKYFVKTAKERKTESDNQKLGRYMSSIKKELELIEHGMSQLKLHQDCACEGFKFQYLDNMLIEVKYWLKKAQSIDRVRPKKTDYEGIEAEIGKSMNKATNLQIYFLKPCNDTALAPQEGKTVETPIQPSSKVDTLLIKESPKRETNKISEVAPSASPFMDTVMHKDVSLRPNAVAKPEKKEEASEPTEGAEVATSETAESLDDVFDSEPAEIIEEDIAPVSEPVATVMDTVRHKDVSTAAKTVTEPGSDQIENNTDKNEPETISEGVDKTNSVEETIAVELAKAPIVESSKKDSTITKKKKPEKETKTASAVMDTLKHMDVSQEPAARLEKTEETDDTAFATPQVMDTVRQTDVSVAAKTKDAPKAKPVIKPAITVSVEPEKLAPADPNDFHYSVQIATGNANTSDLKYSSLKEEVYSISEAGMNKYRVGKYKSLKEAKTFKNKAFNSGFIDAFIVVYNNGERISFADARNIENAGSALSSNPKKAEKHSVTNTPEKIKTPKLKKKDDVFLTVQIGAILSSTDPVYELIKYERLFGSEVHVLHGDPMRFYTGKATTAGDADAILIKVRKAGIQEAFLIGISNNKRIDYNAALEHLGL